MRKLLMITDEAKRVEFSMGSGPLSRDVVLAHLADFWGIRRDELSDEAFSINLAPNKLTAWVKCIDNNEQYAFVVV